MSLLMGGGLSVMVGKQSQTCKDCHGDHFFGFEGCGGEGQTASRLVTPQPIRAVGVLFSPMVSRWAGGTKKFVPAVSQKP